MNFLATETEIFDFLGVADPDAKIAIALALMSFGKEATDLVDPASSRKKIEKTAKKIARTLVFISELLEEYDVRVGFMPFNQIALFAKSDDPDAEHIASLEEFREIEEEKAIVALTPGMTLHLGEYVLAQKGGGGDGAAPEL